MRLTLKFTETDMLGIMLLCRSLCVPGDDYEVMAAMLGGLVQEKLDQLRQPPVMTLPKGPVGS